LGSTFEEILWSALKLFLLEKAAYRKTSCA
jgi:hypothetical protein